MATTGELDINFLNTLPCRLSDRSLPEDSNDQTHLQVSLLSGPASATGRLDSLESVIISFLMPLNLLYTFVDLIIYLTLVFSHGSPEK